MLKPFFGFSTAILLFIGGAFNVAAQQSSAPEQIDTVFTFNQICYTKVPNLDAIRDMALKLAWKPLDNDDLAAFGDKETLKVLEGWDVQVGEKFYRLGVTQSALPDSAKETFPDFKDGLTTSCSMVLDGSDANADIAVNMQTLANKEPTSSDVEEGNLSTTTWAGGNDDVKVFLFNKAPTIGDGGVLAVTVITKK
ncbi:MAG: hypothetical protein WBC71_00290 [Salaquimonas sp.]